MILALAGGCVAIVGTAVDSVDKQSKSTTTITYKVTGDGGTASITYAGADTRRRRRSRVKCLSTGR